VQTMPKSEQIVALCEKHHWKVIVGIEPDQPEDLSDIDLLLSALAGKPSVPPPAPRIGRNDPCPCREWQKVQEVLCGPLGTWKRNHGTMQIADPKLTDWPELGTFKGLRKTVECFA